MSAPRKAPRSTRRPRIPRNGPVTLRSAMVAVVLDAYRRAPIEVAVVDAPPLRRRRAAR